MTVPKNNNDPNLELLLENMIRMQGKINEEVARLNSRMAQVEYALRKTPQHDQTAPNFLFM